MQHPRIKAQKEPARAPLMAMADYSFLRCDHKNKCAHQTCILFGFFSCCLETLFGIEDGAVVGWLSRRL
jgi:hypothetical protein